MKNEIILFEDENIVLEVDVKEETVWLTQKQIAELFEKERSVITKHINNIFLEELEPESNVQKMHIPNSDKSVMFYNLDVIISVGYRVKSKRGVKFRKWANQVLKDHLLKGYTVNKERLNYLEKSVQLIDIASRIQYVDDVKDIKGVVEVIHRYSKALYLLDDYDHQRLDKKFGTKSDEVITYEQCIELIHQLKFNEESDIFALERDQGLQSIIRNIYQTYDNQDIYPYIEDKAANFLYMLVKDHVFIDGNKRVAATLFIYFLFIYDILYKNNEQIIDNNTLAALTILIAESNPKEKEIIVDLIKNIIRTDK